ncbi:MAG: TolC family protein [Magnetococcales bacterium]|nr:TolC family protein [Magnetococcales bacterium]
MISMFSIRGWVFLLSLFLSPVFPFYMGVQAQTFEDLTRQLQKHPSILALQQEAEGYTTEAQSRLGLPDPVLTLGLNNLSVEKPTEFDRYLPTNKSLGFSQKIPNWSQRKKQQRVVLEKVRLTQLKSMVQLATLQKELITALAHLQRIDKTNEALNRQLILVDQLEQWLKGKMEAGGAVFGRFSELDIKREQILEKRISLEGEQLRWQSELQRIVKLDKTIPPPSISPKVWNGQSSRFLMVMVAEQQIAMEKSLIKVKEAAFLPNYGFAATYQQRESGVNYDGVDWFTVKANMTIPLWAAKNQTPKLKAAKLAAQAAQVRRDDILRMAKNRYETAMADHKTANRLIKSKERRRKRLQELVEANRSRYESGNGSLDSLIRPTLEIAKLEIELVSQKAKKIIATAKINALLTRGENP